MKLEQSFEVAAPLERVWEALIDVARVAPCLPGASVSGRNEDGSYNGEFKVKIGPTSAAYAGKLHMESVDREGHTATMQASGTDRRGQGGAKATIVSRVADAPGGQTRVDVSTDYHITGRLARFGRGGMIEEISNRLLGDFATNLQAMLAGGEGGAAAAPAPEAAPAAAAAETVPAVQETPPAAEEAALAAAAEEKAPAAPAEETAPAAAEETAPATAETAAEEQPAAAEAPPAEAPPTAAVTEEALAEETPVEAPDAAIEGATPVTSAVEAEAAEAPSFPGTSTGPGAGSSSSTGYTPPPSAAPESEPISALSLIGSVALKRAKENPAPFVAMLIGFLVALRVLRRRS